MVGMFVVRIACLAGCSRRIFGKRLSRVSYQHETFTSELPAITAPLRSVFSVLGASIPRSLSCAVRRTARPSLRDGAMLRAGGGATAEPVRPGDRDAQSSSRRITTRRRRRLPGNGSWRRWAAPAIPAPPLPHLDAAYLPTAIDQPNWERGLPSGRGFHAPPRLIPPIAHQFSPGVSDPERDHPGARPPWKRSAAAVDFMAKSANLGRRIFDRRVMCSWRHSSADWLARFPGLKMVLEALTTRRCRGLCGKDAGPQAGRHDPPHPPADQSHAMFRGAAAPCLCLPWPNGIAPAGPATGGHSATRNFFSHRFSAPPAVPRNRLWLRRHLQLAPMPWKAMPGV